MSWWTNPNLQPKTKSKFVVVFGGTFYLPNVKSLNKPKIDFDTKEYRLLNHKFNYPGNGTWQPITIKFVDMNGMGRKEEHFDTGAFLWQIMNNTGYTYPHVNNSQFRDSHFRNVDDEDGAINGKGHHISTRIGFGQQSTTETRDTWRTITTPEKSSTIANSFGRGLSGVADFDSASTAKQRISIYQLSPDKLITECWHLINPIVKTIGWGDLDYSADELVEYELGVIYDWAVMDRTEIGKKLSVDELSYKEFMKTLFVDNPEAILDEQIAVQLSAALAGGDSGTAISLSAGLGIPLTAAIVDGEVPPKTKEKLTFKLEGRTIDASSEALTLPTMEEKMKDIEQQDFLEKKASDKAAKEFFESKPFHSGDSNTLGGVATELEEPPALPPIITTPFEPLED